MAHFAEVDENNIVKQVVVISNADIVDSNGVEQESIGIQVCKDIFGPDTNWVQTSYNGTFRSVYAGVGYVYEQSADVFYSTIPPFPSWTLDSNFVWQAPTPKPDDGKTYLWHEATLAWVEYNVGE